MARPKTKNQLLMTFVVVALFIAIMFSGIGIDLIKGLLSTILQSGK